MKYIVVEHQRIFLLVDAHMWDQEISILALAVGPIKQASNQSILQFNTHFAVLKDLFQGAFGVPVQNMAHHVFIICFCPITSYFRYIA